MRIVLLLLCLPALVLAQAGAYRDWTSIGGNKVRAALVSCDDGLVTLKREDGTLVKIGLESLSEADRFRATIPPDAREFDGHHYKLYTDETDWRKAQFLCKKRGGHLVVINNSEENDFVFGLMKEHRAVWIGLSKSMGNWRWDGMTESGFFKWAPNEPSDGSRDTKVKMGAVRCVSMYGRSPFGWQTKGARSRSDNNRSRWSVRFGDDSQVTGYVCEWDG